MPRNISFAITTEQVKNRTKTVTRRDGWEHLKVGEVLNGCVKCMGLKPGEKIQRLCQIRVVDIRREKLGKMIDDLAYGFEETTLEGFPAGHDKHHPAAFVEMFCKSHKGVYPNKLVTRIEFEYVDEQEASHACTN
jgi:hypothetical protein